MLLVTDLLPQGPHFPEFVSGQRPGQNQATHRAGPKTASQGVHNLPGGEKAMTGAERGPETNRDVAGASLTQLIDALSAAIVHDTYINGDRIVMALAEAAVLERELSNAIPRRWRIQQALNALLKMGPHVTAALAAVLEHPSARAHMARMFTG